MTFQRGNRKAGKLTGEQVMEIREKYARPGVTQPMLSREYGVSKTTIANILSYVTWQNVSYSPPSPRPPLEPRVSQSALEASMSRITKMDLGLVAEPVPVEPPKGSWYDQPPIEVPGQEATGIGLSRLEKEAAKVKLPVSVKVGNELDKLEKGD